MNDSITETGFGKNKGSMCEAVMIGGTSKASSSKRNITGAF